MKRKLSFCFILLLLSLLISCDKGSQGGGTKTLDLGNGVSLKLIKVKPGRFQMGSPAGELGRSDDETQHWVTLTKEYWLGETEVTQGQWKSIMEYNPSDVNKGNDYPVDSVSWEDAMKFCEKLNVGCRGKLPLGYTFSLPTEAQWEYACRAGTMTSLNNGKNVTVGESVPFGEDRKKGICMNMDDVGWYGYNYDNDPNVSDPGVSSYDKLVKKKRPNAWGFYDMHGNRSEWCRDWYDHYDGETTDPKGPSNGLGRVLRGGSLLDPAYTCRSAARGFNKPSERYFLFGFRLALVPVQ